MTIQGNMMYRIGLSSALVFTMLVASGVHAQEESNGLQERLNTIWNRLFDDDKEPPKGSRGPLCAIAPAVPGPDTTVIWHNLPVIVWQAGTVAKVALQNGPFTEPFWQYIPSADENHVVYDGEPLQVGQTYTLAIHKFAAADPTLIPRFQVLDAAERIVISDELAAFYQPNESMISDEEWTAIQQADYFSLENYPLDAIQALFGVDAPSHGLLGLQEQLIEEACTVTEENIN